MHDAETKQVKFLQAENVTATRSYVYEGGNQSEKCARGCSSAGPGFGFRINHSRLDWCDFKMTKRANSACRCRVGAGIFRLDDSQRLVFIGDAGLQDIPENERCVRMGNAFDLVGERRQVKFNYDESKRTVEELFEIKLRNHRLKPVEIRVIEYPFRWHEWKLTAQSDPAVESNKAAIEFRVPVRPNEERVVTYSILYSHIPAPRGPE